MLPLGPNKWEASESSEAFDGWMRCYNPWHRRQIDESQIFITGVDCNARVCCGGLIEAWQRKEQRVAVCLRPHKLLSAAGRPHFLALEVGGVVNTEIPDATEAKP